MTQIIKFFKDKLLKNRISILFLALSLANGFQVIGQTISATTHPMTASTGVSLDTYGSLGTLISSGNDNTNSALTNIGFDFWYNGNRYTQFCVNTNGNLRLGALITRTHTVNNLADGILSPKIAPYWDNLTTGSNGYVKYGINGTAPNRTLVVEWKTNVYANSASLNSNAPLVFQAILSETTGKIQFIYGAIPTNSSGYSIGFTTSISTLVSVETASNVVTYGSDPNSAQTTLINAGQSYTFNPRPSVSPSNLTFSNLTSTSMTLNWVDNDLNEIGYAIYSSTDNLIFTFNQKLAANSSTFNISELSNTTIYYFRVYALTEGNLGIPLTGSQSTVDQFTITSGNSIWIAPPCVTSITVEVWGAGGGGGSANNTTQYGGRGGGGGAYAKGVHTVVPGSSYFYSVGTGGNGAPANSTDLATSGGSTWFNAIASTNSVPTSDSMGTLAVGGNIGTNNTGRITSSNGGLAEFCFGNILTASGRQGLGGTIDGGRSGGSGASPGGGSGGEGSLTSDGSNGTTPGGGGGGGNDSPLNKGGDGAIGQIKITYNTSPSTTAPVINGPICSGSTSVSGTSTEVDGTTIEVFVAGVSIGTTNVSSGLWTKSGITPLLGGDLVSATAIAPTCKPVSVLSSITVTPESVGGTITSSGAICSGSSSGILTLSGHVGSIIRWESSTSPFSLWTPIANTSATYISGPLTEETRFRAVIQSGSCSIVNSTEVSVTLGKTITWDGTSWSNITGPSNTDVAVFTGNYTLNSDLSVCSMSVTNNAILTVTSGNNVSLYGALNVDTGSEFVLENNANLLQTTTVANTGGGSTIVKRNTAALKLNDYVLWSSPVSGQQLQSFSPKTLSNRFYTFDGLKGTEGLYVSESPTNNFATGKGYLIRMPSDHPTTPTVWNGVFTGGAAYNGTLNLTGLSTGKFYVTGNPYPSTISADQFISDNGIGDNPLTAGDGIYFWRKTNNPNQSTTPTTSYASYTSAGGVASGGDELGIVPNGVIQVGQGFMVKVPGTTLTFNNGQRIANNSDQFLRKAPKERHRIWLNLSSGSDLIINQMLLAYMTNATQGIDTWIDGRYIKDDSPTALNSLLNEEEFAIQGRSLPFNISDRVPLAFKAYNPGNYSISLDHVDGLFSNGAQAIYLKDNFTNKEYNLNDGVYTFVSDSGTFNSRFEIVYQKSLANQEQIFNENNVVVYKNGKELIINSDKVILSSVKVYDAIGRLLISKSDINDSQIKLNDIQTNKILIIKITSDKNIIVTKKVVN